MAPSDYMRVLRARWWVIALLVLVGTSVAWLTTPTKPPTAPPVARFRATTVLAKGSTATGDTTDASNLALASSLVGSSMLIERTASELGRPAAEVATDLAVAVNDKAGTLQISSVDTDPGLAMREADVLAAQLVTFLAQRSEGAVSPLSRWSFGIRLANALTAYVRYLALTVRPSSLSIFYPMPRAVSLAAASASALFLFAACALALYLARRRAYVTTGWFWYLGMLLPVIGLVKIGGQSMADRYTYLPLIGIFLIVSWGLGDLLGRGRRAGVGAARADDR